MNPNEMKKLKELAPLPLFLLLILFLFPSMLIDPQDEALKAGAESYRTALGAARAAVKNRDSFAQLSAKMGNLESIKSSVAAVLPEEASLPEMIDTLHRLAGQTSVSLEDVRYEFHREYEKLKVPAYQLHMNLRADYAGMRSFLAEIENLASPVIINEIVLTEGSRYALTMRLLVK